MLDHLQSNTDYIDYQSDIVGNPDRGIRFTLTYVIEHDRFYAVVDDTDETGFNHALESVPHEVAKFMIGEEEYNNLKEIQEESTAGKQTSVPDLKQAFWKVLKLAKGGQQSWWAEDLKKDSEEAIEQVEKFYNEKYET